MTVPATARRAGPYTGNGTSQNFSFGFKIFDVANLRVAILNTLTNAEVTATLNVDYTVTPNGDQESTPGGFVTASPSATQKLSIIGNLDYGQPVDLPDGGAYRAQQVEDAFDRLAMQNQQLYEELNRAAKLPANLTLADVTDFTGDLIRLAESVGNIDTVATSIASVNSAATNMAAITAAPAQAAAAASSATNADASAAAAAASYDAFDDRYLGAKAGDPTVDNDGNALLTGALYWNTTGSSMRVYSGTAWGDVAQGVSTPFQTFSGTGAQTAFTLSGTPGSLGSLEVFISGVRQVPTANYTVSGTTLTFIVAPPSGTNNIFVRWISTQAINVPADGSVTTGKIADLAVTTGKIAASVPLARGIFYKADPATGAFTKTGAGTAEIKAGTRVDVAGTMITFATATAITMPALTAGTDYAIYACTDGTVRADASFTAPTGYTTANSRKIGGFHYAPGGHSGTPGGGTTTPGIWAGSFWDLKFKPSCSDPRGMEYWAGSWMDMYLTGVDAITLGSSRYNVTIADGSSPPKVPTAFGGNGTTTYGSYTWFEATELAMAMGKRLPTQREYMAHAYGTTEATSSGGTDVPTTGVTGTGATSAWNLFTSIAGLIQATGCMYIWCDDRAGPFASAAWNANTEGRGSEHSAPNAGLLGGAWNDGANSGSRCSLWAHAASISSNGLGSRFCADHLQLD